MWSSSKVYCCVPLCNQTGRVDPQGNRVGFFTFPKDPNIRQQWLQKIRRDVGPNFSLTKDTKICSLHFREEEIKTGISGKKIELVKGTIPSRFAWRTSPRKRHSPLDGSQIPEKRKQMEDLSTCNENGCAAEDLHSVPVASTSTVDSSSLSDDDMVSNNLETSDHEIQEESLESLKMQLLHAQKEIACLNEDLSNLKSRLAKTEAELVNSEKELKRLSQENNDLKSRTFCINNLSDNDSISFYTGFPNLETFKATLSYLNPGENGENIRYWRSIDVKVDDERKSQQRDCNKPGRRRTLQPEEEFFLVLCRLRQGFNEKHLAFLFGISQPTVSRIFISWINFMFLRFGNINIWPSREEINKTMLEDFKVKYPNTRVILDCTEIKCQMPSSLLLNSRLFSSYKNHTTLKGLIGIAPSGAITFTSQLYTGSISDREIVERSGILDLPFSEGDDIMADKGFTIEDLLPLGVTLNIPPFLQMWAVCTFLCNVQDSIITE
ncbi:uncharacterized protein [Porites lutea]|uniref:uncharacterized protein n=1 Tax=Porites lutea TaxID=51062 RepID=UPI003CC63153